MNNAARLRDTAVVSGAASAAVIYNSAVASWAIAAAWEVGALAELHAEGHLDARAFAERRGLDPDSTIGMFRALAAVDIVKREDGAVAVSSNFDDVYRFKSFFHWLSRGSAELFRQMPSAMARKNGVQQHYQRDSAAIAFACREIDELCYAPTFWAAIDRLDFDFGVVADLGCGSGGRLIDILTRFPKARGIGIDIASPALAVAREAAAAARVTDRVSFTRADVTDLPEDPRFKDVELITCFMMGHDFWPRDRCVAVLRGFRTLFPAARRLLLGDATRTSGIPDAELPVFTLGFELGHDLMGITIPTTADWESVFEEAGWTLAAINRIDMTVGEVIFELE
ncbi:MAG: methyltransferase [Actinomycetia bacterium]|nr:methyltransferase [Actinomycetes bacterium]